MGFILVMVTYVLICGLINKIHGYLLANLVHRVLKLYLIGLIRDLNKDKIGYRPIIGVDLPQWDFLRHNYRGIRGEFDTYTQSHILPKHREIDHIQGLLDKDPNTAWRTLYLRMFNKNTDVAKLFPLTMTLLQNIDCPTIMFSYLEPGTKIQPHTGIYCGVLRYHLCLKSPLEYTKCYIRVHKDIYQWQEGHDIVFDDTFEHEVHNNTNEYRLVLFLDITRDFNDASINLLNKSFLKLAQQSQVVLDNVSRINDIDKKRLAK